MNRRSLTVRFVQDQSALNIPIWRKIGQKGTNAMIGKVFPNGAEVIAEMPDHFNSDITVILVKWRDQYITAKIGSESDKEWFFGKYFPRTSDGFVRAFADFMRRSGKAVEPVE